MDKGTLVENGIYTIHDCYGTSYSVVYKSGYFIFLTHTVGNKKSIAQILEDEKSDYISFPKYVGLIEDFRGE